MRRDARHLEPLLLERPKPSEIQYTTLLHQYTTLIATASLVAGQTPRSGAA